LLDDNGQPPGSAGSRPSRREVSQAEFDDIRSSLTRNLGEPEVRSLGDKGRIEVWKVSPTETITCRTFSDAGSKGYAKPETIDVNKVSGVGEKVDRIHVKGDSLRDHPPGPDSFAGRHRVVSFRTRSQLISASGRHRPIQAN
jgi:hypothetical protein